MSGRAPRQRGDEAAAGVEWIALADIMRAHGVAGELRLRVYNSDSEVLLEAERVLVRDHEGNARVMAIEGMRGADRGHLLAKLEGVDDRDAADLLRGGVICAERAAFAPLDEGEFYVCDLVGARLIGPEGELGTIEELRSYPTTDVLLVRPATGALGPVEIPLVDDFVDRIDVDQKVVVVRSAALQFFEP
jgi:16S rRNA processing protein RimM